MYISDNLSTSRTKTPTPENQTPVEVHTRTPNRPRTPTSSDQRSKTPTKELTRSKTPTRDLVDPPGGEYRSKTPTHDSIAIGSNPNRVPLSEMQNTSSSSDLPSPLGEYPEYNSRYNYNGRSDYNAPDYRQDYGRGDYYSVSGKDAYNDSRPREGSYRGRPDWANRDLIAEYPYDFNRDYHLSQRAEPRREYRSRTPGPEMMRGSTGPPFETQPQPYRPRTPTAQEMRGRSSGSADYHHNISGTPDFIPASSYLNPPAPAPPSARPNYQSSLPQDVPYRTTYDHTRQRPLSGPELSHSYGSGNSQPYHPQQQPNYPGYTAPPTAQDRNYDNYASYPYNYTKQQQNPYSGSPTQVRPKRQSTSFENEVPVPSNITRVMRGEQRVQGMNSSSPNSGGMISSTRSPKEEENYVEMTVFLKRQESGFGFRIIGGTEEGSQVSHPNHALF